MNKIAAFLFLLLSASGVRADWQSGFSYDVAVSTSASGPFASSTIIWTSGAAPGFFPSSIDIWTDGAQPGSTTNILVWSSVVPTDKDFATFTHSPFFIKLTVRDNASGLSDAFVLGGSYEPGKSSNDLPVPSFGGHFKRRIGNREYDVTALPPEPRDPPGGVAELPAVIWPPGYPYAAITYAMEATINVTDVTATPEPASLLLALPAAIALGIAVRRRRPL
jgi:hypothetical protein